LEFDFLGGCRPSAKYHLTRWFLDEINMTILSNNLEIIEWNIKKMKKFDKIDFVS